MMMEVYQEIWQLMMIAGLVMSVTSVHAGILFVRNGNRRGFQLMQQKAAAFTEEQLQVSGAGATLDTWQTRLVYLIQRKIAPDDDDDAHQGSFFLRQSEMKKGADINVYNYQPIHPTNAKTCPSHGLKSSDCAGVERL